MSILSNLIKDNTAAQIFAVLGLGAGGGLALNEAYDRLGDIGERAYADSAAIANLGLEQTQFQPFTVTSATGGQFGVMPTEGGGLGASMALSPQEQAMQQMLFSVSYKKVLRYKLK